MNLSILPMITVQVPMLDQIRLLCSLWQQTESLAVKTVTDYELNFALCFTDNKNIDFSSFFC